MGDALPSRNFFYHFLLLCQKDEPYRAKKATILLEWKGDLPQEV